MDKQHSADQSQELHALEAGAAAASPKYQNSGSSWASNTDAKKTRSKTEIVRYLAVTSS